MTPLNTFEKSMMHDRMEKIALRARMELNTNKPDFPTLLHWVEDNSLTPSCFTATRFTACIHSKIAGGLVR